MRAAGGQAEDGIARLDVGTGDQLRFFRHADRESRQVVLAGRVHAGHLGRLATDQGTAGQLATLGDTGDDGLAGIDVELAAGEIVEEEQGLGALDQDVVDAHGDQVLADGVVLVELEGQLQLGPDTIGTGDQDRLLVVLGQLHQGPEAADATHDFRAHGAAREWLDAFDQGIAGVDVDAGITIGKTSWLVHGRIADRLSKSNILAQWT